MTKRLKIAFECLFLCEEQCAADGYRWLRLPWSVILTLNVGLDDGPVFGGLPLWHCSIALLAPDRAPLALGLWNDDVFVECQRFIRGEVLAGIGRASRSSSATALFTSAAVAPIEKLRN